MSREKRTPKQDSNKGTRAIIKERIAEKKKIRKKNENIKKNTKKKEIKKKKKQNGRKPSARAVTSKRIAKINH